jgi:hypothetical protein
VVVLARVQNQRLELFLSLNKKTSGKFVSKRRRGDRFFHGKKDRKNTSKGNKSYKSKV